MPRFFTEKICTRKLEEKINEAWKQNSWFEEDEFPHYLTLTQQIGKDLNKVDFNSENISDGSVEWGTGKDLLGYRTLDNGLTYLGIGAGGDWEIPVFFIIYWSGSELRGYIPKNGNTWNTNTKTAYGNDEDADQKELGKRKSHSDELDWDCKKIIEDIKKRILFKVFPNS